MIQHPVSIVITAYSPDSKPYLDLCIESIENLEYPKDKIEVIIVGRPDYLPQYENIRTISPERAQFYPPVGLNFGMKAASHELMLVLNDDTILTKHCLSRLADMYSMSPHVGILMPISNDQQGRYAAWVGINSGPYRIEQLSPIRKELMNNESKYPPAISYHDTLCIYAFMISKPVYSKVGDFDEELIALDDTDYTQRVRNAGLLNAIAFNSIIYHFGGVTADKTFSNAIREESVRLFKKKWLTREPSSLVD